MSTLGSHDRVILYTVAQPQVEFVLVQHVLYERGLEGADELLAVGVRRAQVAATCCACYLVFAPRHPSRPPRARTYLGQVEPGALAQHLRRVPRVADAAQGVRRVLDHLRQGQFNQGRGVDHEYAYERFLSTPPRGCSSSADLTSSGT